MRPLDECQLLERVDLARPEVVPLADVGHHGDVAAIEPEPLAEDAAPRRFEHGRLDPRVEQHHPGTLRAAAIAGVDPAIADPDAVGAGHADRLAGVADDLGDQPRGGRLAVDAGDRHDRHPAGLAFGIERARRSPRRPARGVPAEGSRCIRSPGRGVDLDDHARLFLERPADVLGDRRRRRRRRVR